MAFSGTRNYAVLVPIILVGQILLTSGARQKTVLPRAPDFESFPREAGGWRSIGDDPVPADIRTALEADAILSRTYVNSRSGLPLSLFSAWFQSQTDGNRQPHSPKVCLPGSGWVPIRNDLVEISAGGGRERVNRYVVANRGQHATVLYWYQTPQRTIAGEWEAKLWLLADGFRYHRTDAAVVRIVVSNYGRSDEEAGLEAASFAEAVYPLLRARLHE